MTGLWPKGRIARNEAKWFYIFIGPWIIGFIFFTAGPVIGSLLLSFTKFNVAEPPQWVGLGNYSQLFADRIFFKSLQVTSYYTLLAVPLGIVTSLLIAVLLNQNVPFLGVYRTIFYIPALIAGGVAMALLFQWILNPQFGLVNYFISVIVGPNGIIPLGIVGPRWLIDQNWVIPSLVLMSVWGFGGTMLIYLAGLQGVPTTLYEAATIDGANSWQKFRYITVPMLSPVILFTTITGVIGSFQVFTPAYIVSGGNGSPNYASMFYVLYLYLNAFQRYRFGLAAAQAWILFLIIMLLTYFLLRTSRRLVYYESPGDEKML
ncbi:MAG: sugar ABC transporter permease [Caldilineaceae bacterium]